MPGGVCFRYSRVPTAAAAAAADTAPDTDSATMPAVAVALDATALAAADTLEAAVLAAALAAAVTLVARRLTLLAAPLAAAESERRAADGAFKRGKTTAPSEGRRWR